MIEAGFPGFEVNLWLGVFLPAAAPRGVVTTLNKALVSAMQHPNVASGFEKVGAEPLNTSPAEAAAIVKAEFTKWAKVVRDAKLRAD
jgi:tripartite-type tricarboxylate transporter receptor subunit TctC